MIGRTAAGWNFGALSAVTGREHARTLEGGQLFNVEVEPLTNYAVGRVRWDGDRGGLGGIATAVHRDLQGESLTNLVAKQAYVGGTDAYLYLDQARNWEVQGSVAGSWMEGSTAAIGRQQRSSRRYYQRPDATHLDADPDATTMAGWRSGASLFGNGGFWTTEASVSATSPGYEINDLGFQRRADQIRTDWKLLFQELVPDRLSRYRWVSISKSYRWNYAREEQEDSWWIGGGLTFPNYWSARANVAIRTNALDDRNTRGGPLMRSPFRRTVSAGFGSDTRKALSFRVNASRGEDELGGWSTNASTRITAKPSDMLRISFGPSFFDSRSFTQYVSQRVDAAAVDTFGSRYIFGGLATSPHFQ